MHMWFDREGKPIDTLTAARYMEDINYKRVAQTSLKDGTWISTVWLGLDHSFGEGPPLIFETMVFPDSANSAAEEDMERYATEAEARAGHKRMVEKWRAKCTSSKKARR